VGKLDMCNRGLSEQAEKKKEGLWKTMGCPVQQVPLPSKEKTMQTPIDESVRLEGGPCKGKQKSQQPVGEEGKGYSNTVSWPLHKEIRNCDLQIKEK